MSKSKSEMTDDEIFDRIINGGDSGLTEEIGSDALSAKIDGLCTEIRQLRDQMYTLSMANVSEGGKATVESYNKLIVAMLADIKKSISSLLMRKLQDDKKYKSLMNEVSEIKERLAAHEKAREETARLLGEIAAKTGERTVGDADSAEAAATDVDSAVESIEATIGEIGENSDEDIETSIARLKEELSRMVGIIDGDE